jgi:phage-related protein (TIGR01555 family)
MSRRSKSKNRKSSKRRNLSRAQDGIAVNPAGMGTTSDRGAYQEPMVNELGYGNDANLLYGKSEQFYYTLYRNNWEAGKIVDIPPADMTREGWEYKAPDLSEEDSKKLSASEVKLGFVKEIDKALRYERLYGGGLVFLGIKGDKEEDPSKPLDIESIGQDDLAFTRAIDLTMISGVNLDTNPLSEHYNRPEILLVRGQEVHRSRFLIFDGNPILAPHGRLLGRRSLQGFGDSVLRKLYKDINHATGTRQSAMHLIEMASINYLKRKGLLDNAGTTGGQKVVKELKEVMDQISIYRAALIGKDDEVGTMQASFGSVPELLMTYLQVLSAASDIPATRFLGNAPGGLNATGEGDLRNYWDKISSDQNIFLGPPLNYFAQILSRSTFGNEIDGLHVDFNPLYQPNQTEEAAVRKSNVETITQLYDSRLIDEEASHKMLRHSVDLFDALDDKDFDRIIKAITDYREFETKEAEKERELREKEAENGEVNGEETEETEEKEEDGTGDKAK